MTKERIKRSAKDVAKKASRLSMLKVALATTSLFVVNVYMVLSFIYKENGFTVSLDRGESDRPNLTIYESLSEKVERTYLKCADLDCFSDISIDWISKNVDNEAEGSHNGENYIAYTFYAENQGQETINYWAKIEIDDVIKDVDDALRVILYKNGERVVYAKPNSRTGEPERGTVAFYDENIIMLEQVKDFKVGDIDKYTIVIFVEGSDPECTDAIIGGEIAMHMQLTEEHIIQSEEETEETT